MATYVISDIHGQYDMFIELLDKIQFQNTDTLYILGDILDRGPHPIKTLMKLMEMPNVICIVGNHEYMALECLEFLMKEITDMSIEELDEKMLDNLVTWQYNGSKLEDNPHPGYIYRRNNHIAIDCGASYHGERLAALCLDTGKEYYSSSNEMEVIDV